MKKVNFNQEEVQTFLQFISSFEEIDGDYEKSLTLEDLHDLVMIKK